MKLKQSMVAIILSGVLFHSSFAFSEVTSQVSPELSGDGIIAEVDKVARKSYATRIANVKINTCKYTVVNNNIRCVDKPRVVIVENAAKVNDANDSYARATLLFVSEPLSDKGSTLLSYEYEQRNRDNDNWLYLPALGKVKRVIASDNEGGSVFGSEFSVETTENAEARKIYEYTYKYIEESTFQNRPVWVVEMTPTPERAKKTRYEKIVLWIDKETAIPLKEDYYRNGKIHRQKTQSNIKKIDNVNVALTVVMNNLSTSRISQMDHMSMRHDVEIPDEYFSQRVLTDFPYRERQLSRFRSLLGE